LTQSGRFGQFNWTPGNYGTQITNDPGQGVWVAWGADSAPGVTGAWARVYSGAANLGWWGALGDCNITPAIPFGPPTINTVGTDNGPVLANFGTWARYQSPTPGLPVVVEVPTPSNGGNCLGWNPNNCVNSLVGIKNLIWKNNKGLWQNRLSGSFQPWQTLSLPIRNASNTILGLLISATNLQVYIVSGSYNSTTGVVTLILKNAQQALTTGFIFTVSGVGGTGSVASVNVINAAAIVGTSDTTLEYTIANDLTLTINSNTGFVQQGTSNQFIIVNPSYAANINLGDWFWANVTRHRLHRVPPEPVQRRIRAGEQHQRAGD